MGERGLGAAALSYPPVQRRGRVPAAPASQYGASIAKTLGIGRASVYRALVT